MRACLRVCIIVAIGYDSIAPSFNSSCDPPDVEMAMTCKIYCRFKELIKDSHTWSGKKRVGWGGVKHRCRKEQRGKKYPIIYCNNKLNMRKATKTIFIIIQTQDKMMIKDKQFGK